MISVAEVVWIADGLAWAWMPAPDKEQLFQHVASALARRLGDPSGTSAAARPLLANRLITGRTLRVGGGARWAWPGTNETRRKIGNKQEWKGNLMTYLPNGTIVQPSGEGRVIPGPEGLVVKVGAGEASGSIAVLEATVNPGFGPPLHIHHGSEEIFYVLEGELELQVGDQRVSATSGAFVLVPRGTVHGTRVVGPEPVKALVIFAPAGPDKVFDELVELAQEAGGLLNDDDPRVQEIMARCDNEYAGPPMK